MVLCDIVLFNLHSTVRVNYNCNARVGLTPPKTRICINILAYLKNIRLGNIHIYFYEHRKCNFTCLSFASSMIIG
jgi:hypothetical protein